MHVLVVVFMYGDQCYVIGAIGTMRCCGREIAITSTVL